MGLICLCKKYVILAEGRAQPFMGAQAQLLLQPPPTSSPPLNPPKVTITKFSANIIRCCSTRHRSNWDPSPTGRSTFNHDQGFYSDGDDDAPEFSAKQRIWWSDNDNGNDFDDPWDVDEEDESWIFKILKAFGWMFPAVAISLLLGTGPNAFFMALAVPLGQTVLSLAFDRVWGTAVNNRRSRPRTTSRRKPFARAAKNNKASKQENEAGKGPGSYQSWVATDGGSYEKGDKNSPSFGGWDDLDKKERNKKSASNQRSENKNELPKQRKKAKLSTIGRIRDRPLLLRLLIAVFPFLGSWTKLLF